MFDYSNAVNTLNIISGFLEKKDSLARYIEKSFDNRKLFFKRYIFLYMSIFLMIPLGIILIINKDFLNNIIENNKTIEIIKIALIIILGLPLSYLVYCVTNIKKYFLNEVFKDASKQIRNYKYAYNKSLKKYKLFRKSRIRSYIIEAVLPIIIIGLIVFLNHTYSLYNLIVSFVLILFSSYLYANHYDNMYSIKLYVKQQLKEIDDNELIDREVVRINGVNFYLSSKKHDIIFFDNTYIFLSFKVSKFENVELSFIKVYFDEKVDFLKEFRKSKMCENKKEVDELIELHNNLLANVSDYM